MTPLAVEPFGWARSLNAAMEVAPDVERVCIISNDVGITFDAAAKLFAAASRDNASCGFATFSGRTEPSYRVPRNTCCVWRRDVLDAAGGFDEGGDQDGGMEDYAMALTAYATSGRLPVHAASDVPLAIRPDTDMHAKLAAERRAMLRAESLHDAETVSTLRAHLSL